MVRGNKPGGSPDTHSASSARHPSRATHHRSDQIKETTWQPPANDPSSRLRSRTRSGQPLPSPVTYGHPFHPMLVTVPIGAWVLSFAFDIAATAADEREVFVKGAFWLIGAGILGAIVAALFGLLDLLAVPRGTPAFRTGLTHMTLNLI